MNKSVYIKKGIRESFRSGTSKLSERPCYGYKKDENGHLQIDKVGSRIVRRIFNGYSAGLGTAIR
jgi:hypothetical protein